MTKFQKSWAITGLCCFIIAAISACVNLMFCKDYDGVVQPGFITYVHVATAFVGAGLLARFIQGSGHLIDEPAPGKVLGTYFIARAGEYARHVHGKSAFFSTRRTALLLGFLICLMSQFVFVAAPDELHGPDRHVGLSAIRAVPA